MEVEDWSTKYALLEETMRRMRLNVLNTIDWANVRDFIQFLKIFIIVHYTAKMYFDNLLRLYEHLRKSYNDSVMLLNGMTIRMKFDKYWKDVERINILLFVVVILDPGYKLVNIEFFGLETFSMMTRLISLFEY